MGRIRNVFQRFMYGRYGNDRLNIFILAVAFVLIAASVVFSFVFVAKADPDGPKTWTYVTLVTEWVSVLLIMLAVFRAFSRNSSKRSIENQKFVGFFRSIRNFFTPRADRKTHKYFRCPKCSQKVRVPRNKGTIMITCPRCGEKFKRKT